MMTTVASMHHAPGPLNNNLYVGRPTDYGNPFKIGRDGNRDAVIAKFKAWWLAPEQTALRKRSLHECRDKCLLCWCYPEACHADVIADYVNGYWLALDALKPERAEDPPL